MQYELGDPLPNEIKATVLHPITEEKLIVTVNVSYSDRPLFCTSCKSLGHLVGACLVTKLAWRAKNNGGPTMETHVASDTKVGSPDLPTTGELAQETNVESSLEVMKTKGAGRMLSVSTKVLQSRG